MIFGLFKSSDTKIALEELDNELRGKHMLAFKAIEPQVKKYLSMDNGVAVTSNRERGFSHNLIVHMVAKVVVDQELPLGNYHTYRGTLSMIGNDMWKLYLVCIQLLKDHDLLNEEEAENDIASMKEDIANAG